ncbi:MAG TPA: carboxypeptidase regulatory-like domain-containing protein [Candidatus Sulfotelmatobacter sp.]|nr:carboxypeptidase regulatory-like domain-containing protein [Candidatus Sulfotelmatobacter sp.]
MNGRQLCRRALVLLFAVVFLAGGSLFAGVTASISGTVKDSSGASIAGAKVTATNVGTAISVSQPTNGQGYYSFQSLPLGTYTIEVEQAGFKTYRQTGLVLDVNAALLVDAILQVGQKTEHVDVAADALHVESVTSQMGEVIEGKEMTDVPLVSRSFTDLLPLQPGVVSQASGMTGAYAGPFISAGFPVPPVSGSLNSGALSVNGMRESANAFILNGMLTQEIGYSGAGAIPNLDSLAEFRILTNNADAEFGNYAGAQINVVTKSGTNQFHGNVFEFLRNTDLDAKNFFDANGRGAYHQNQFGGTFGGPIIHDKLFFFADYQGNRVIQEVPQTIANAPSAAMEAGDLSGIASSLTGTVTGAAWASQLSTQLGQPVTVGEPYYFTGCTSSANCVLPNAQLPMSAFNPISTNLITYIQPWANSSAAGSGLGTFSSSSGSINIKDNKFSTRLDANTGAGLISAYYYFDKYDRIDPYWSGNAPLYPGFAVDGNGITQNINIGVTKTLSGSSVNEFRVGYFRLNTKLNRPKGGTNTTLANLGFASGNGGAPGIYVGTPSVQGVPEIDFNNYIIGVPSRPNQLLDNIYQVVDNFSKVIGTHTIKFGGQYHFNQLEENLSNVANGNFFFGTAFNGGNSETGSDFADFLLGAPSSYVQGQSYPSYGRSFYLGFYGQDSWRVRPNLTLNYGLRYDVSSPWKEKYNEIQTIIPGEQSQVYPGSPTGWLFPTDKGVPRTLAPTRWNNFAPRIGMAYSFGEHDGFLGGLLGKAGSSSLRAGYTLSYSPFEGATDFNEIGDAPFGDYTGQFGSTFAAPFTNRATGTSANNFFPVALPPKGASASHPASGSPYDTLAEFFNAFGTIGSSPAFYNGNRLPYAENYELSFERQLTGSDLISLSYVGTQGHRLLSSLSANPGNPALCLATPGCGPGGENNIYINGSAFVLGTRSVLPGVELTPAQASAGLSAPVGTLLPDGNYGIIPFGNDSYFITAGASHYNSAQVNYRHTAGRLQLLLGYTYSKSIDNASGYGEQINPINPSLSRGLAAFDSTHNFVVSYNYELPFDKWGHSNKLTTGWALSGITRFETGLPVTMVETDDHSLLGTAFGGPITLAVDTPDQVAPLHILNPRNTPQHYFFDPTSFASSAIGLEGNARRRFFHGPGTDNFDLALVKNTKLSESLNLSFRAEFFNIFNHAQFITPSGILSSGFGQVTQAQPPRLGQLSLKLNF